MAVRRHDTFVMKSRALCERVCASPAVSLYLPPPPPPPPPTCSFVAPCSFPPGGGAALQPPRIIETKSLSVVFNSPLRSERGMRPNGSLCFPLFLRRGLVVGGGVDERVIYKRIKDEKLFSSLHSSANSLLLSPRRALIGPPNTPPPPRGMNI